MNQEVHDTCELTGLLNTIFSKKLSVDEKLCILEHIYGITLQNKEKETLNDMCNLAEGLVEEVTATVTENDIKKTFCILQKNGTDVETALKLISDEFDMGVDDVKRIVGL